MADIKNKQISRRSFLGLFGASAVTLGLGLVGCGSVDGKGGAATAGSDAASIDKLTMVWLPNESSSEFDAGREEFGKVLEKYAGVKVELMTTTDYNVAIEAIASGKAQLANMGAEGFIQAQKKNSKVLPLVTTSDTDGKLDGAKYYSRICVPEAEMSAYADSAEESGYSIKNIKGKRMSFVSATSTSGFKVPCNAIMKAFPDDVKSSDELSTPGFFSQVLFGNSHPGSAVNLLQGDADVAAFDDVDVDTYLDVPEGERDAVNAAGSVYSVKADAPQPFDRVQGKKFGIIQSTPVLNGPIAVNTDKVPQEIIDKLVKGLTSKETSEDELLFAPRIKRAPVPFGAWVIPPASSRSRTPGTTPFVRLTNACPCAHTCRWAASRRRFAAAKTGRARISASGLDVDGRAWKCHRTHSLSCR